MAAAISMPRTPPPPLGFQQLLELAGVLYEELAAENASLRARLSLAADRSKDCPAVSEMPQAFEPAFDSVHLVRPEAPLRSSDVELPDRELRMSSTLRWCSDHDAKKMDDIRKKFEEVNAAGLQSNQSVADIIDQMVLDQLPAKKISTPAVGRVPSIRTTCSPISTQGWASKEDNALPSTSEVAQRLNSLNGRADLEDSLEEDTFFDIMLMGQLDELLLASEVEKIQRIRNMFARRAVLSLVANEHSFVSERDTEDTPRSLKTRLEPFADPLSFSVIVLNAITMAVSTDHASGWTGWAKIELSFTTFFLVEIAFKMYFQGFSKFLFGPDWGWNVADAVIVLFAVIDAVITLGMGTAAASMQTVTLMRLVRLTRVLRVVRLLHFEIFKELLLMIRGVAAGVRTLFWAIVILLSVIFCLSMLMRQTIGVWCSSDDALRVASLCTNDHLMEYGDKLFGTLPRSGFTVFRCLTEGCSSYDGTPLLVHIYQNGWLGMCMALVYIIVYLSVTFGLFNLIMAVFVESTMESAKLDERRRRRAREKEAVLVGKNLEALVIQFCQHARRQRRHTLFLPSLTKAASSEADEAEDSHEFDAHLDVSISRGTFAAMTAHPEVEALLEELQVHVSDPTSLFDTLDADGSGSLDVREVIKGIMRLRGPAEKSDVVACLLSLQSMRENLRRFEERVAPALENLSPSQEDLKWLV